MGKVTLSDAISDIIVNRNKEKKEAVFVVEYSNGTKSIVKVYSVGDDFIDVIDSEAREFMISLSGGISKVRDVTDSTSHPWPEKVKLKE